MKRLLLVEDEEHLAIIIKYNLEAEGYEVLVAGEGPAALKMIEDDPLGIDLVVLDIMLPGMNGYAVCEAIRAQGLETPVLILSARTLTEDRIRGFDVGADQYLQKPFDLDELLSRVRNLLSRRQRHAAVDQGEGPHTYEFARAKINFDTFEVTVADEPVRLTHTEIKLLRYFIEREGSVISRSQLLEDVWGFDSTPTTRTVDNFIVKLRKYFEADPSEPRHFLSVRGAGYRFVARGAPNEQ
ncbi:MAG TPA: response regulator transcription factor [Pirellulales bacterium]|nr:response regulator transcription factor [Pirellulales bacterium]